MTVATFVAVAALPEPWLVAVDVLVDLRRPATVKRTIANGCDRIRRIANSIEGPGRSDIAGRKVRVCGNANDRRGCNGRRTHSEQGNEGSFKNRWPPYSSRHLGPGTIEKSTEVSISTLG